MIPKARQNLEQIEMHNKVFRQNMNWPTISCMLTSKRKLTVLMLMKSVVNIDVKDKLCIHVSTLQLKKSYQSGLHK